MISMKEIKKIFITLLMSLTFPLYGEVNFNFTFSDFSENTCADSIDFIKMQFSEAGKILGSYLKYDQSVDILVAPVELYSTEYNEGIAAVSLLHAEDVEKPLPGFYNTIVGDKIRYGIDRNDDDYDGLILYNLGSKILQDFEDENKTYAIQKNIMHGLIHILGFGGVLNRSPFDKTYEGRGVFSAFDFHIHDKDGIPLWTYKNYNDSAEINEFAYFAGPKTIEAFFGLPLPLPQSEGYYHACASNQNCFAFIGNLMNDNDLVNEDEPLCMSPIEIAMLEDIGFEIDRLRAICKLKINPKICIDTKSVDSSDIESILSKVIDYLPEDLQTKARKLLIKNDGLIEKNELIEEEEEDEEDDDD